MYKTGVFVATLFLVARAGGQAPDFDAPHHPTHVLVRFKSAVPQNSKDKAHSDAGAYQVLQEYSAFEGLQLVEVDMAHPNKSATQHRKNRPRIRLGFLDMLASFREVSCLSSFLVFA